MFLLKHTFLRGICLVAPIYLPLSQTGAPPDWCDQDKAGCQSSLSPIIAHQRTWEKTQSHTHSHTHTHLHRLTRYLTPRWTCPEAVPQGPSIALAVYVDPPLGSNQMNTGHVPGQNLQRGGVAVRRPHPLKGWIGSPPILTTRSAPLLDTRQFLAAMSRWIKCCCSR